MIKYNYYIQAKRTGEKDWTPWSQAKTLAGALDQCQKIKEAGFLYKVFEVKSRVVVFEDE